MSKTRFDGCFSIVVLHLMHGSIVVVRGPPAGDLLNIITIKHVKYDPNKTRQGCETRPRNPQKHLFQTDPLPWTPNFLSVNAQLLIYVCVCVYIYIYIMCVCVCIYIYTYYVYVCVYIYIYICTLHVYTYAIIYHFFCVYIYIHNNIYIYIYNCVYI